MEDSGEPYSWWVSVISQPLSIDVVIALLIMLILLICSALISGSEVAYFSISQKDLRKIKSTQNKTNKKIILLLNNPKELLATILISNNFINVAIVILSTFITTKLFDFQQFPVVQFVVQVIIVTFLILLFGEVIPKVYAIKHTVTLASFMAFPLKILKKIFRPISLLLISTTSIIDKRIKKKDNNISMDELSHALELTTDENTTKEEHKILKGIVRFGNIDVKQIMKSRMDVVAFEQSINYKDLLKSILQSGYSRIPIYQENFDKIIGVLYIKDMLPHLKEKDSFSWQTLIRTPYFVPENKKINDLLKEFQEKKNHLAIVVDEYGGTSGIVTLEDVIEEIIGEITDEFDEEDLTHSKLDDNNYVFEGKTLLNDFYRIVEIEGKSFESIKGEADTLAGFILELAGRIPQKKEKIIFKKFIFTIESADKRRIKRVKVTIQQ